VQTKARRTQRIKRSADSHKVCDPERYRALRPFVNGSQALQRCRSLLNSRARGSTVATHHFQIGSYSVSEVVCYMLNPLPRIRRILRRYGGDRKCAKPGRLGDYCNGEVFLDEIDYPAKTVITSFNFSRDDPRWPKVCDGCGAPFVNEDTWQVFVDALYTRSDTGAATTLREAAPGAIWDAWWMPDKYKNKADGLCLTCKLPNGYDWMIDGGSQQSPEPGAWQRNGTPPKLTVSPSILAADYHGWLRDGVLVSV
jgi:hypothetical protein